MLGEIILDIAAALIGTVVYLLIALVTPIAHFGEWSVAILVALILIARSVLGGISWRRG